MGIEQGNGTVGVEELRSRLETALRWLRDTKALAVSLDDGARRLAAGDDQRSAERLGVASDSIANGIAETSAAVQELARSQESVAATAKSLHQGSESTAASLGEIAASVGSAPGRPKRARRSTIGTTRPRTCNRPAT